MKNIEYLLLILILAALLRFYGLNWDQGYHLHPDERMITMVADRIHWPKTEDETANFFTPQSSLNPQFFAYGSFPIYLLKIAGTLASTYEPAFGHYEAMNLVGRSLSAFFDLGIIILLFLLGKKLFNDKIGLLASFFYTLAVLPIQLAHFYAVDTPLTFFTLLTLYLTLRFMEKPLPRHLLFLGSAFGFALATKTSALLLIVPIILAVLLKLFSHPKKLTACCLLFTATVLLTFLILEPFALIDHATFIRQTLEQQQMTKDAFTFPYTLQYVGIIPYWYELKNIFLWGLGPILATIAFAGTIFLTFQSIRNLINSKFTIYNLQFTILLSFFWLYFGVVGHFAVAFMRYMLPLYPLFCLFAAFFLYQLKSLKNLKLPTFILYSFFLILLLIWPLSFIKIYTQPNTRVESTNWIYKNIPLSSILALEHWDDALPLGGSPYTSLELPLYEPDTPVKWQRINQVLENTDYIVVASNRLYVPLRKLTNCQSLPPGRCYRQTAEYYRKLFTGQLGFEKVAEFFTYPKIPLLNITINDFPADESFTVYDHPKVMIFQKSNSSTNEVSI